MTERDIIKTGNEQRGPERLAASMQRLGELREITESTMNAIGSLEAEQVLIANAPGITILVDGSLKNSRNDSSLPSRIASLPPEQVCQIQDQIDVLLTTIPIIGSLGSARRLEPYLPVVLPKTQAGFKTLKMIAERFTETIPILNENSLGDIPRTLKVLTRLDEQLKAAGLNDSRVVGALSPKAEQQAQVRLEKSKIDGFGEISRIRSLIAQQRISALKREPVDIPGTHGYSRYEVLANQIIEREDLFTQVDLARAEAESRRQKEQDAVLDSIAKRKAINTVVSLIDQDPHLCQVLAKRAGLDPESLRMADQRVKKMAANNALDAKRIILSVEDRRVFIGETVIAQERVRLTQDLLDPLSFIARLTDDELSVIRSGITKISDERSVYELAGNKLRKQLEDEVTDDEIVIALTKILLDEILSAGAPDIIDAAVTELGIDRNSILRDPRILDQLRGEIIARGLDLLIATALPEPNAPKVLTITELERRRQREESLALFRAQQTNRRTLALEAKLLLDQNIEDPDTANLGAIVLRKDIKSSLGPFQTYPEYKTAYPQVVIQALENLYAEYNQAFRRLVAANREWDTDYQYSISADGTPVNNFIRIDMVGLPIGFLEQAANLSGEEVQEALKGRIFEIENSFGMYSLMENLFSDGISDTLFKRQFFLGLENIRRKFGRPIALLAVTDQKYQTMRETEFGKRDGESLSDDEVREFSGFDRFFSPEEFRQYIAENAGQSDYLLYVRSSDPVVKMKKPELVVDEELLVDEELRRIIKANSLTFNIDNPNWPVGDVRRINDSKEYLCAMGMAFPVFYVEDLSSAEFNSKVFRAKPMKGTYGGYGQFRGTLTDTKFRRELRNALLKRGAYVVQPELRNPLITNKDDGCSFMYIDRLFFSCDGKTYQFMGGERTLMPIDSTEAQKNTVHGNPSSVYAEII